LNFIFANFLTALVNSCGGKAIDSTVALEKDLRKYELSDTDWEKVKEVVDVLKVSLFSMLISQSVLDLTSFD